MIVIEARIILSHELGANKVPVFKDYSVEDMNELQQIVSRVASKNVVRCYNRYTGSYHFASRELVRPLSVLILDDNDNRRSHLSLVRRDVPIQVNPYAREARVKLLFFKTSSPSIYESHTVLNLLALLGKLYKQVHSLFQRDFHEGVWELLAVYESREIDAIYDALESFPYKDSRTALKIALERCSCRVSEDEVLLNALFPLTILEKGSVDRIFIKPLYILQNDIFYDMGKLIRYRYGLLRYFSLVKRTWREKVAKLLFLLDFLERTLHLSDFYIAYAYGTARALEYVLNHLSNNPLFRDVKDLVLREYTTLQIYLDYLSALIEYNKKGLESIGRTINVIAEIVENDLLTKIEFILLILTIISVLSIILPILHR